MSTLKGTGHSFEQEVNAIITEKKNTVQKVSDHTVYSSHTPGTQSCFNQPVSLNNQMAISPGGQLFFTTAIINAQFCSYMYLEDNVLMTARSIQNMMGVWIIKCSFI